MCFPLRLLEFFEGTILVTSEVWTDVLGQPGSADYEDLVGHLVPALESMLYQVPALYEFTIMALR